MKLYKAKPEVVQVHEPKMREGSEQAYLVEHGDGSTELLTRAVFNARYAPVLDLRV